MFRDNVSLPSSNVPASELFPESPTFASLNDHNNLDDIWGSAPSSPTSETLSGEKNQMINEPSDIPRLRSEHSTAGYRDGLSTSKNTTIQEGFDEGYGLGAVMGMEVGILLGSLEGIYNAIQNVAVNNVAEKKRTEILLNKARREMRTEEVFGTEWWSEDGVWKFEVLGEGIDSLEDFTFKDVVESHPLIRKWTRLVNEEVNRWGLDLTIIERAEEGRTSSDIEG